MTDKFNKRLWMIWDRMQHRCFDAFDPHYRFYGRKGIKVCAEWLTYKPFKEWALANGYEKTLTIDRIDSTKDYEPDNCRFLSLSENAKLSRKRKSEVMLTAFGETKSISLWVKDARCVVSFAAIQKRIKTGKLIGEEILTTPNSKFNTRRSKSMAVHMQSDS